MKTYKVTIDFRRGPSFSVTIISNSESGAKHTALTIARGCGFDEAAKKTTAVEEVVA